MAEITPENMLEALAARIDCPVCDGKVRLTLASNAPGDLLLWACSGCNSEWHENGKPRWSIELPVSVFVKPHDSGSCPNGGGYSCTNHEQHDPKEADRG